MNWQETGLGLGEANCEEVHRKIRVSLTRFVCSEILPPNSVSLVIRKSSLLLVQGGDLSQGSFMTYFREKGWVCQCDFPVSTLKKKNFFSLRYLICQGATFWGAIFR